MKQYSVRLHRGDDLRGAIEKISQEKGIQAGCVISSVGSLEKVRLRMADGSTVKELNGPFEIVSVTGTLSVNDSHIHLCVADSSGQVFGGHLKEGSIVHTTVELILLAFSDEQFSREMDPETGYEEWVVVSHD